MTAVDVVLLVVAVGLGFPVFVALVLAFAVAVCGAWWMTARFFRALWALCLYRDADRALAVLEGWATPELQATKSPAIPVVPDSSLAS